MTDEIEPRAITVHVLGGPMDGTDLMIPAESARDFAMVALRVPTAPGDPELDEPYFLRVLGGEWSAVWPPLVKEADDQTRRARDDLGPSPERVRASHDALGSVLLTEPCAPGTHDWSEWEPTRAGNKVRRCMKCQVGQGSIL